MLRIDSHQHFWRFDPVRDSWITDDMQVIQRDFMPQDLTPLLEENKLDGCIAVQSDQSEADNAFLIELAAANPIIKGIVGWVDLQAENIHESLEFYAEYEKVKGFRHVLQGEPERDLMLKPHFKRGIAALAEYGYTYDLLIFEDQLRYAAELVRSFPDQKFVLDHIAKPAIKTQQLTSWTRGIKDLAQYPNVYCKVSGMVTEADWLNWKQEDFTPCLDVVFEAFGTNRVMYGSDWPVCLVAGGYQKMINIVKEYTSALSNTEQLRFWGTNASDFYQI